MLIIDHISSDFSEFSFNASSFFFQRKHFDSVQMFNEYLREEYHLVQDLLWNSGHQGALLGPIPDRKFVPDAEHDACRIHGTLALNKVEGNFHVTAGKNRSHLLQ